MRISEVPFTKGQSGNPHGRPRGQLRAIANLALEARKHSLVALKTIVEICKNGETETVRLAAANSLLDRGFGRPTQSIELATDGPLIQFDFFKEIDPLEQQLLRDALKTIEHDEQLKAVEDKRPGIARRADGNLCDNGTSH
jgi:Family of unknown function (DUF5681)